MSATSRNISAIVVCVIAIAILVGCALSDWSAFARSWLIAFLFLSLLPLGSLSLLLIHGFTGGAWGRDFAFILVPAARAIPLLILMFVPVVTFHGEIYDWSTVDIPADIRAYYLNMPFFAMRTLVALVAWSTMAWGTMWRNRALAGPGLAIHFLLMTFIPADWVLQLHAPAYSTSFGWGWASEQILWTLGWCAILRPLPDHPDRNDLADMLIASILGVVYFCFTQFIIRWYGNIPDKVAWYTARSDGFWPYFSICALVIGAILPFLLLMSPYIRRRSLRIIGTFIVSGIVLHVVWLTAPDTGLIAFVPAGALIAWTLWATTSSLAIKLSKGALMS